MEKMDYNKYETLIKVGHTATKSGNTYTSSDLEAFPTPAAIGYLLADVDKDAFTDLKGYTHRNRVRNNVLSLTLEYPVLSEDDLDYILTRINPQWIYVETTEKKGRTPVTDNNGYHKYINKLTKAVCWLNTTNGKMYNASYVEITPYNINDYNKVTTGVRKTHKMYASDKQFNSFRAWIDENDHWHEVHNEFTVTFVEE